VGSVSFYALFLFSPAIFDDLPAMRLHFHNMVVVQLAPDTFTLIA